MRFKSRFVEDHDLIVMGAFNVPKLGDALFRAPTSHGLRVPKPLPTLKAGDRVIESGQDARYDQILHLPTVPENFTNAGGALDFFIGDARIAELFPKKGLTREKSATSSRITCRSGCRCARISMGIASGRSCTTGGGEGREGRVR